MRKLLYASLLLLVGCETHEKPRADSTQNGQIANQTETSDQKALTPFDQSESKDDRMLTQQIRKMLMDDDRLSTSAKNIKVITINGVVTLKGELKDKEEKMTIVEKIKKIPGIRKIDDHLGTVNDDFED